MGRRVLPALLAVIAAVADAHGSHGLAFYMLLAAVPFASASAIVAFGEFLDRDEDAVTGLQALLWAFVVMLLVLSCAARSPATQTHTLPPLGASALLACLCVFALKACVFAVPLLRRLALVRPAKP